MAVIKKVVKDSSYYYSYEFANSSFNSMTLNA